jgi:hypothetical protein
MIHMQAYWRKDTEGDQFTRGKAIAESDIDGDEAMELAIGAHDSPVVLVGSFADGDDPQIILCSLCTEGCGGVWMELCPRKPGDAQDYQDFMRALEAVASLPRVDDYNRADLTFTFEDVNLLLAQRIAYH